MSAVSDFAARLESEGRSKAAAKILQMEADWFSMAMAIKSDNPTWPDDLISVVAAVGVAGLPVEKDHTPPS